MTAVCPENNRGGRKISQLSIIESTMLDRHRQSLIFQFLNPFHPCRVLLLFLLVQCHYSTTVRAEANVTVDDGDSRITYSPPGAWRKSEQTQLDYGGSHMLTQNPNATAIFNFTGESTRTALFIPWLSAVLLFIPSFPLPL